MMIRPKHIALTLVTIPFCYFIFLVNYNWGNTVEWSFTLAFYTFWLFFLGFNMYWEIRDFWQYRWAKADTSDLTIEELSVPIKWDADIANKSKILSIEYIHAVNSSKKESEKNPPVVIFSHGFSDNKVYVRHYTLPIAYAGYDVIGIDSRGAGKSRSAGNKNQFYEAMRDLGDIVDFIRSDTRFLRRPIILAGISLGGMSSINQGILRPEVVKIVGIASMSNYRGNLLASPVPMKGAWWLWFRYRIFGVPANPIDKINEGLSPAIYLQKLRDQYTSESEWNTFIHKKLYLVHAYNDKVIKITNFYENLEISELESPNYMITKRGGHNFLKYEGALVSEIIYAINS